MEARETKEVPSFCYECYNFCPTMVQVQNGVVVRTLGNPKSPYTEGRLCPKGNAVLMRLYDPHRVKTPLKRTNPQKGIGVDPQWQEISWDEALDIISQRLKHQRATNPHGLKMPAMELTMNSSLASCWGHAFGTPFVGTGSGGGGGAHCGNALHTLGTMVWDSYRDWPEWDYTKYAIFMGTGEGFEANRTIPEDAKRVAECRIRGMKVVVVDPCFTHAAAKADEWVPIRPGTDGALILGMLNLLLNDYGIYDAPFLQEHTNAPYLIGPDGHYIREEGTVRPLVWDAVAQCARPYEYFSGEGSLRAALLGEYMAQGLRCRPAFQLIKDHVREYTPERVEEITTVPAATVRRLAQDLGSAAQIGSTIEIEGEQWPLRPAVIMYGRGTQGHTNATLTTVAIYALEMALGLLGTPGGTHRTPSGGMCMKEVPLPGGPDGITLAKLNTHHPYAPPSWPPKNYDLKDFFPINMKAEHLHILTGADPARWSLAEGITIFAVNTNPMLSVGDLEKLSAYHSRAFVIVMDQYLTETAEFADIVLPETLVLENQNLATVKAGSSHVGLLYAGAAVQPMYQARDWVEVLLELAERCGFLYGEGGFNYWVNMLHQLPPAYALGLEERYSRSQVMERVAKRYVGEEGYRKLISEGIYARRLPARERYMLYRPHRLPIYQELILRSGEELVATLKQIGAYDQLAQELEFSHYVALPSWKPSPIHQPGGPFDLYAVNGKSVLFTFGRSAFNPWLMEIAEKSPSYPLRVAMNSRTALKKGLRDGQSVWIESASGRVQGTLHVTEGIHPECVGILSTLGHWCDHPIARGKGTHFNSLLTVGLKYTDPVFTTIQGVACRVRVYPAEGSSNPTRAKTATRGGECV